MIFISENLSAFRPSFGYINEEVLKKLYKIYTGIHIVFWRKEIAEPLSNMILFKV